MLKPSIGYQYQRIVQFKRIIVVIRNNFRYNTGKSFDSFGAAFASEYL